MFPEEPIVFEPIVLDLTVASHVDHPALANPFPISVGEWIRGKRYGWLVRFQQVELPVRNFIGVGEREGRRIPGKERKMRIIGYGEYGYPRRNETGSDSGRGADQYDVMHQRRGARNGKDVETDGNKRLTPVDSHKPQPNGRHL